MTKQRGLMTGGWLLGENVNSCLQNAGKTDFFAHFLFFFIIFEVKINGVVYGKPKIGRYNYEFSRGK
jgi:hypothetical protein